MPSRRSSITLACAFVACADVAVSLRPAAAQPVAWLGVKAGEAWDTGAVRSIDLKTGMLSPSTVVGGEASALAVDTAANRLYIGKTASPGNVDGR